VVRSVSAYVPLSWALLRGCRYTCSDSNWAVGTTEVEKTTKKRLQLLKKEKPDAGKKKFVSIAVSANCKKGNGPFCNRWKKKKKEMKGGRGEEVP